MSSMTSKTRLRECLHCLPTQESCFNTASDITAWEAKIGRDDQRDEIRNTDINTRSTRRRVKYWIQMSEQKLQNISISFPSETFISYFDIYRQKELCCFFSWRPTDAKGEKYLLKGWQVVVFKPFSLFCCLKAAAAVRLTCHVAVCLICLQAGDARVIHTLLQVVQFLPKLLDVALLAVQLHLKLIAICAFLCQLLLVENP